jgi:hypothetical protein
MQIKINFLFIYLLEIKGMYTFLFKLENIFKF